ncbi:hypothetical protein [Actinacidiphila sp. bgisy145]|uniref:hypothetical protein n=1 Tax=Actinacidiphila sp. bgisy145 TaxID=3413792 RepID=UPI003EBF9458
MHEAGIEGGRRREAAGMGRTAVAEVAAWWVLLAALDVVLISSVNPVELLVAAGAALAGAMAAHRLRRAVGIGRPHGRGALRALAALPWSLLRGSAALAGAVVRGGRRPGGVRRVVLRPGTGAGGAGLLLAASADTCVLTIDEDGADGTDGTSAAGGARQGAAVRVHALRRAPGAVERALTGPDGPR